MPNKWRNGYEPHFNREAHGVLSAWFLRVQRSHKQAVEACTSVISIDQYRTFLSEMLRTVVRVMPLFN